MQCIVGFVLSLDTEKVTRVLEGSRETLQVVRSSNHALYENIKYDLQQMSLSQIVRNP